MIPINDYRQFIAELTAKACEICGEEERPKIRLAITESQLINMLKDLPGLVVAGNIPGADIHNNGFFWADGECLLMVLEKMPADYQGTEREYTEYARLQKLMDAIVRLLLGEDFQEFCDKGEVDFSRSLQIEWEYNTYGGFSGLSVTFRLKQKP